MAQDQEIIIYSGIHCAPCDAVKNFLHEHGFEYTEKNVNKDKQARQEMRDMGMISIPVTNTSVNPARSFASALFAGGPAVAQLWLFWLAPILGGIFGGLLYKSVDNAED